MRQITALITTLAFTFSGISLSSASTAEIGETSASASTQRFATSGPAIATPATFADGIQYAVPGFYFSSVSCPSAGNCVAAGQFANAAGFRVAFTQTQTSGVWDNGNPATFGPGVQNTTPNSYFTSVSCPSAGNCVAAGQFDNASGGTEGFTQTQTNGVWNNAIPVTFADGIQSSRKYARISTVSCASAGHCVVAGSFKNAIEGMEAFTQTQINGRWATARPAKFVAGIQNTDPNASFWSVSCSSAGNCVAAGQFINTAERSEAFTQTQTNGVWATAIPATFGAGTQNTSPRAGFKSVSCPSVGNCVAAGQFRNDIGGNEAFTQTQTNGRWATAIPVTFGPGIQGTNPTSFNSVSCPSVGNCVAAGNVAIGDDGNSEAFTQTQSNGRWATAIPVTFGPGIQSATPSAYLASVSCSSSGYCVAVGEFATINDGSEGFFQEIPKFITNTKAIALVKPSITGMAIATAKGIFKLTAIKGTWSGYPTPVISYKWYSCTGQVKTVTTSIPENCKSISNAARTTLAVTTSLKGKYIAVLVTGKGTGTTATQWLSKSTERVIGHI